MSTNPTATAAPLTADERDDLAAGHHYEREAAPPTCICGTPWICPKWADLLPVGVEQRIAQYQSDRQETLSAVADPSHKSGETA